MRGLFCCLISFFAKGVFRYVFVIAMIALIGASITEAIISVKDRYYACSVAQTVVSQARAATPRQKVLALRNYLRKEVHIPTTPGWMECRPFLRQGAAETLQSHEGWCGEET